MTLNDENRKILAKYMAEKAEKTYKTAISNFDIGDYEACMNRLYYVCFYFTKSLHYALGVDYEHSRHKTVMNDLSKNFVKTGLIPPEFGADIKRIEQMRSIADYNDDYEKRDFIKLPKPVVNLFQRW